MEHRKQGVNHRNKKKRKGKNIKRMKRNWQQGEVACDVTPDAWEVQAGGSPEIKRVWGQNGQQRKTVSKFK